jgi:amino acid transporter
MDGNRANLTAKRAASNGAGGRYQFGTFGGVFTPSILMILGAIMFMRANFVTGQAGVIRTVIILLIAEGIAVCTALSMSAVATNMKVRGGGAYFMISRVLGPEFGGAIGLVYFLGLALSVPFYILGFSEALVFTFPALAPYSIVVNFVGAGLLFAIAFAGADWSIRTQYVILGALALSIAAFMAGAAEHFSTAQFAANLSPGYTEVPSGGGVYSFWPVFAIFFPAVTGFLAGVNMSGDLKHPARSIPTGTFLAIGVGILIYAVEIILFGGGFDRTTLINEPFNVMKDHALWGLTFLVPLGVIAATLSSALASYLGAPRVLQALARDRLLKPLDAFAAGSAKGDEPRPALWFTLLITGGVLAWAGSMPGGAAFNVVASVITMFFLYTYGMINLAAFIEAASRNPSFRPRFKLFHWSIALLGGLGCLAAAVLIDPLPALIALAIIATLYWYLRRRQLTTAYGDARRGFVFARLRANLLSLRDTEADAKNWRPTVLVFTGMAQRRQLLATFADWLEAGRGIVLMASILVGPQGRDARFHQAALRQLTEFCRRHELGAFPLVLGAASLEEGIRTALQAASVGPVRPNLALFGFSEAEHFASVLRAASQMGMSLVVLHGDELPPPGRHRRIDVWWRGQRNGSLLLLLAYLLAGNLDWAGARIRVLRHVEREEAREPAAQALRELIETARVDARAEVVASAEPFPAVLHRASADSDCVLLGFELPAREWQAQWQARFKEFLTGLPPTLLVHNFGEEDLLN